MIIFLDHVITEFIDTVLGVIGGFVYNIVDHLKSYIPVSFITIVDSSLYGNMGRVKTSFVGVFTVVSGIGVLYW